MRLGKSELVSDKPPTKLFSFNEAPGNLSGVSFLAANCQMTPMSISNIAKEIKDEFDFLDNWEDRYAHLIDLGKSNAALAADERTEAARVRGCASQVWLVSDVTPDSRLILRAESDAMIVSGLIALLVRLFSNQTAREILAFDANAFLEEIGILGALTAQRSNGLASMLTRINKIAEATETSKA